MEVLLGEKHLSQQKKGETAVFSELFPKSPVSFWVGLPCSLFIWMMYGPELYMGEENNSRLICSSLNVKMASTLNSAVRWNQFDRDLIWSGSGGVHMDCRQSGKRRLMWNSVAAQPPHWVWTCGALALLGEVFHLVPNKGTFFPANIK